MTQSERLTVFESQESSSPITTRAVAGALLDQYTATYDFATWQSQALRLLSKFPQGLARYLISRAESLAGLNPILLENLTSDQLASQRVLDYKQLTGRYPCITIGAALGGASASLALALGGPFLPQAFVTTLKGGSPDGTIQQYFHQSLKLALDLTKKNQDLFAIQHYDPVHDEWMTRRVNHLRFKLLELPNCYRTFIRQHLQPGGSICYLNSQASWLRYRIGDRNVFQVGGWGDIPPEEFLSGSTRLDKFARSVGISKPCWTLEGYSLETGSESEWGTEPGLSDSIKQFCDANGYRFFQVTYSRPHDYSNLAFKAINHILKLEGRQPAGVVVEMFTQFDTTSVMRSGLLPLWLVFNTGDSLSFLREMRPEFPDGIPVFFSPLATFSPTPDLVPFPAWETALEGTNWINIGARASHYPADPLALLQWSRPLREWVSHNTNPIRTHITPEALISLI